MAVYKILNAINKRAENFGIQYIAFGIFGLLNYPIYYLIWAYTGSHLYENLTLRLTATFLCFILLCKCFWPKKCLIWFGTYWYFTLLFCLPFFFTFMLLKNNAVNVWLMSTTVVIFWLLLLVDLISYILILVSGIFIACLVYALTKQPSSTISEHYYLGLSAQYIGAFMVITFFAYRKGYTEKAKISTVKALGSNVAHEIRTPLASIQMGTHLAHDTLVESAPQQTDETVQLTLPKKRYDHLLNTLQNCQTEVNAANTIIDMLLNNIKTYQFDATKFETLMIHDCIDEALQRYPLTPQQRCQITYTPENNFSFHGVKELMIFVLFNLLKNALAHAKNSNKINIKLWTSTRYKNQFHLKDFGCGMSPATKAKIFNAFYSKRHRGTGLGLYFCQQVMQNFGGYIHCDSVEHEWACFTLTFPKIDC